MGSSERFTLRTETVGCLPIVNHFMGRMGGNDTLIWPHLGPFR